MRDGAAGPAAWGPAELAPRASCSLYFDSYLHGILDTGVSRSYESCQTVGNYYYTRRVEPVEGGAAAGARERETP